MAKTRQVKETSVIDLTDKLGRIKAAVFTNFDGLNVKDTTALRNELRGLGIEYTVVKKTLMKLALKNAGLKDMDISKFTNGLGLAMGYDDEALPAKSLYVFSKKHPELKLIGGIFENRLLSAEEVKQLALLPGKSELHSKLVWLFNYPISGLVNVMAGNLRSLLYTLQAMKDKKSSVN